MKISELPKELRELAELRRSQCSYFNNKGDTVASAFNWEGTPEKSEFWSKVDDGKDVSDHPMYPKKKVDKFKIGDPVIFREEKTEIVGKNKNDTQQAKWLIICNKGCRGAYMNLHYILTLDSKKISLDLRYWWCTDEQLELITIEKHKFKEGDSVQISDSSPQYANQGRNKDGKKLKGTVVETNYNSICYYKVDWGNNRNTYNDEDLEPYLVENSPKLIVGDKYVPIKKSAGSNLESSLIWRRCKKRNQPYLYYIGKSNGHFYFSDIYKGLGGDQFLETDVVPYIEENKSTAFLNKFNISSKIIKYKETINFEEKQKNKVAIIATKSKVKSIIGNLNPSIPVIITKHKKYKILKS